MNSPKRNVSVRSAGVAAALLWLTALGALALRPRYYSSRAVLIPSQSSSDGSRALAFAAQIAGVGTLPGGGALDLYGDLALSDSVLSGALASHTTWTHCTSPLRLGCTDTSTALVLYFTNGERPSAVDRELIIRRIRGKTVRATVNRAAGTLTLTTRTTDASVSAALASALTEELLRHARDVRRRAALADAAFLEGQLQSSQDSLEKASAEYAGFLKRNRGPSTLAPDVDLRRRVLERRMQHFEQSSLGMRSGLDQALLTAARETPVLSIVESPRVPRASEPRRTALLATIVSAILAVVFLVRDRIFERAQALLKHLRVRG